MTTTWSRALLGSGRGMSRTYALDTACRSGYRGGGRERAPPDPRAGLDIGFPVEARGGEHGGTVLHAAAYCGSSGAVRTLLDRGADLEARDATWNSTPLDWAVVGSGGQPADNPQADWMATVSALLEAGASIAEITLSPDDPKAPSSEVADLLRRHGVADSVPG
jgi:ankyrin repeat protein